VAFTVKGSWFLFCFVIRWIFLHPSLFNVNVHNYVWSSVSDVTCAVVKFHARLTVVTLEIALKSWSLVNVTLTCLQELPETVGRLKKLLSLNADKNRIFSLTREVFWVQFGSRDPFSVTFVVLCDRVLFDDDDCGIVNDEDDDDWKLQRFWCGLFLCCSVYTTSCCNCNF